MSRNTNNRKPQVEKDASGRLVIPEPPEPEKTCIGRDAFANMELDLLRDYAKHYGMRNAKSLTRWEIVALFCPNNKWIPMLPEHEWETVGKRRIVSRKAGVDEEMDDDDEEEERDEQVASCGSFPVERLPPPVDEYDGTPPPEVAVSPEPTWQPPKRVEHELVYPPRAPVIGQDEDTGADITQPLSEDWLRVMLEEQEAHHQALKAQLQEALAAARAAATDVMMLQAQLKSERGETDGLLQAIGLICGPGIVGEVKRKARYAAEHGMIPREDPGDDDNSANGDNERNDARNEINGQKMAPKVNDVSENGRRKSPTPVASNPRENGTATQRMDRPANGSSQNGGKNGSRPAVNDLENSDSSSSESSPETTYLSRLRGRLFSKRQREDDDAGESDRDAHEAHAGDDTVIIEDPSQIDDTVRQHKRARRGRSPTDQDEGSSSGSESSSPSASGPPSQASSHKQQLPQRSILGLASRPRPPPTQPRARKLKPKQLKRDKERIVINRDTGEIVHYVPDYTQTKEYKWRARRGEQDLVAKPAMPIDLEAEIRTLVGTKGTEERFEFSDDIPEGDIIFDEDY